MKKNLWNYSREVWYDNTYQVKKSYIFLNIILNIFWVKKKYYFISILLHSFLKSFSM